LSILKADRTKDNVHAIFIHILRDLLARVEHLAEGHGVIPSEVNQHALSTIEVDVAEKRT
jgi:hypothetical protein